MIWKFVTGIGKSIINTAQFITPTTFTHLSNTGVAIIADNEQLADDYQKLQAAQIKLEYLQEKNQQNLGSQLAKLHPQNAREIQNYIQTAENNKLSAEINFEKWRWQQEKNLQLQLLELNQNLQAQVLTYQRQTSLQVLEEQKKLDNSPLWLVTSDIINHNNAETNIPLRVFFAPPNLQFERLENAANNILELPNLELTIAEGLRQFLLNYTTSERKIDFLAGAWVSKSFHSEASIKSLFSVFKTEPTLILESEIDGKYLNFRIAHWFKNGVNYNYRPVISRLPYQEILFNSAKERALVWEKTRNKLIELGKNPEEIDQLYGGDDVQNLKTLKQEEELTKAGINNLKFTYLVNEEDFQNLAEFLIIYHCIFTGLVADDYFLREYQLPPLLPSLIAGLIKDIKASHLVEEILESINIYYEKLYQSLSHSHGVILPELMLDFALVLTNINHTDWASNQVVHSLKYWLQQRGLLMEDRENEQDIQVLLSIVEDNLTNGDRPYIEKLNQCCQKLGLEVKIDYDFEIFAGELIEENLEIEEIKTDLTVKNTDIVKIKFNTDFSQEMAIKYVQGLSIAKKYEINPKTFIDDESTPRPSLKNELISIAISSDTRYFITLFLGLYNRKYHRRECQLLYVRLFDFNTGKPIEDFEVNRVLVNANQFSPSDYQHTIISNNFHNHLAIYSLNKSDYSLTLRTRNQINLYQKHLGEYKWKLTFLEEDVKILAISKNEYFLATSDQKGYIKVWEIYNNEGKCKDYLLPHDHQIDSLVFSPNSNILVSSGSKKIKIWEVETGELLMIINHEYNSCKSLIFSPDGHTVLGITDDKTITQWNINTKEQIQQFKGHNTTVRNLAIHPEGKILASSSDNDILKFWYIPTGEEIHSLEEEITTMLFSSDGENFATVNHHTAKLWRSI
jgi:WD40 repeat protein